jgi:protein gp37
MSKIEWTGRTLNPIRARGPNGKSGHYCVKCSPGCKNCYSSAFQPRLGLPVFQEQAKDPPELYLDAKTLGEVLRRKKPTTWFWCSMTDMFGEWVPDEWIAACFGVMAATPWHTHQVLTKRPERAAQWFEWIRQNAGPGIPWGGAGFAQSEGIQTRRLGETEESRPTWNVRSFAEPVIGERLDIRRTREPDCSEAMPWPLPNVWLGTSVEDQKRVDERIPHLLSCPAAVRFISAEPLLGPVDIARYLTRTDQVMFQAFTLEAIAVYGEGKHERTRTVHGLDWVIVGAESGNRARDFELAWARSLRDQCDEAHVACFIKQLGRAPLRHFSDDEGSRRLPLAHPKGGDIAEWPLDLRVREFPKGAAP